MTGIMSSRLNSNHMVHIPKVVEALSSDQFRPIIFGNFVFKIATEILANLLGRFASRVINPYQFGFIKRHTIDYYIVGASEYVNVLNINCKGGNMALKIDICKAFDTLEWDFINEELSWFGFSVKFVSWLRSIFE